MEEEEYDESLFARQWKLLREKDMFVSLDKNRSQKEND